MTSGPWAPLFELIGRTSASISQKLPKPNPDVGSLSSFGPHTKNKAIVTEGLLVEVAVRHVRYHRDKYLYSLEPRHRHPATKIVQKQRTWQTCRTPVDDPLCKRRNSSGGHQTWSPSGGCQATHNDSLMSRCRRFVDRTGMGHTVWWTSSY